MPIRSFRAALLAFALAGCAAAPPVATPLAEALPGASPAARVVAAPKIALALGGGAARGFAHIGVIKALEAQGIRADIIVGTSTGSVVGALYASGINGFELQRLAFGMEDGVISDWSLPDRGIIKGEALQNYVNAALGNRPIEKLRKTLAIVATDLQSGEAVVFRTGNTGMAVRASSSVPGLFQPVRIGGREFVDGGLVSPVPVKVARSLGADVVIAVDISSKPRFGKTASSLDVMLQTFNIMSYTIAQQELAQADVVIRPNLVGVSGADFQAKHLAILEGERAVSENIAALREKIARAAAAGRP
ncbi:MAG: esterase [Betaproteobacteria bacterium RIFCSPLOWO2_02_FULL_65_20]|nr:MAG: esterase [Betaproteobacteria bacterium RIFCSPLOWO2_02_FULL_65_20]